MKISIGDYLVLTLAGKTRLGRCSSIDPKSLKVVVEKRGGQDADESDRGSKHETVDFLAEEVLSNLGKTPKIGSVYGQRIEPVVKEFTAGNLWENVKLYQHLDDAQETELKKELVSMSKRLRGLNVGGIKHIIEVRQPGGKYAGFHKYRPKSDVDILCIKPQPNLENLHYLIFHEYAHGIWHRMLNARTRLKWMALYHEYIVLKEIEEDALLEILDEIQKAGSIGDFLRDCPSDDVLIVKDAVRHISHVHGLTRRHLEYALNHGESIAAYWPATLELSEKETCVTEYARKSPEELFAESLAFHFLGRLVPKKILALIEYTLSNLIRGGANAGKGAATKRTPIGDDRPSKSKPERKPAKSSIASKLR